MLSEIEDFKTKNQAIQKHKFAMAFARDLDFAT
jgi:hypothetical protein